MAKNCYLCMRPSVLRKRKPRSTHQLGLETSCESGVRLQICLLLISLGSDGCSHIWHFSDAEGQMKVWNGCAKWIDGRKWIDSYFASKPQSFYRGGICSQLHKRQQTTDIEMCGEFIHAGLSTSTVCIPHKQLTIFEFSNISIRQSY